MDVERKYAEVVDENLGSEDGRGANVNVLSNFVEGLVKVLLRYMVERAARKTHLNNCAILPACRHSHWLAAN